MGAALLIARSRLRRNLLATVLLVLLAGLGGAVVMASVAGIRRADRGWAQLQADHPTGDAVVALLTEDMDFPALADDDLTVPRDFVADLPGVTAVQRTAAMPAVISAGDDTEGGVPIAAYLLLDPPVPALSGRPILVAGRTPDPEAADEGIINEQMAAVLGLEVGDQVTLQAFTAAQRSSFEVGDFGSPAGVPSQVQVVGIVRGPEDLLPPRGDQLALSSPYMVVGPAWFAAHGPDVASYGTPLGVDLDDGPAGVDRLTQQVTERFGEQALVLPGVEFGLGIYPGTRAAVTDQLQSEGRVLTVFAIVAALMVLAIVGQSLFRQISTEHGDAGALSALGLTRPDLVRVGVVRTAIVAVGAAIVAVVGAALLSQLLPRGLGSRVQRDHGLSIDAVVLVVGAVVVAGTIVALAAWSAWRVGQRTRGDRTRRLSSADRLAGIGGPVTATLGLRMAFDRSVAALTGRAVVGAGALAVGAAVAAASLLGSFQRIVDEPERLGARWDVAAGNFSTGASYDEAVRIVNEIDGVRSIAGEMATEGSVEDLAVAIVSFVPVSGTLQPTIQDGRAPSQPDEVLLGAVVARDLGVGVGDVVSVQPTLDDGDDPTDLTVVGVGATATALADASPGRTILVSPELLVRPNGAPPQNLLIELDEDADRAAVLRALDEAFPMTVAEAPVLSHAVSLLDQLAYAPVALALVIGLMATAAVVNSLVGSVRRRRRDLGVLKAIGCSRGQLRAIVGWQATTWAILAAAIGVPLGLIVGSLGWRAIERSLGVESPAVAPVAAIALAVGLAVLVANLASVLPARSAARISAAEALRTE